MIPPANTLHARSGVALLTALAVLVVVGGIMTLMFARTVGEIGHASDDVGIVQSLLLARGAVNLGGAILQGPAREALDGIVQSTSSTTSRWSYGTGTGAAPTPTSVLEALTTAAGSVAIRLQAELDALLCGATVPSLGVDEVVTLRIHVTATACGSALPTGVVLPPGRFVSGVPRSGSGTASDQTYGLPFVIVAAGRVGPYARNVVSSGQFQFTVGRSSFAQYALFTNVHATPDGTPVWFTDRTLFDGPVHSNQNFRFFGASWFGGAVTSAGCSNPGLLGCTSGAGNAGAEFYGAGFQTVAQMSPPTSPSYANGFGTHAPELAGGVDWHAAYVPLPANSQDQRSAATSAGLAFGHDLLSLQLVATDAAMNAIAPGWPAAATFQTIRACRADRDAGVDVHVCEEYRYGADRALQQRTLLYRADSGAFLPARSDTTWRATGIAFNGVIHTTGAVERLSGSARTGTGPATAGPALAAFAQITIAADTGVRITGDLLYERPPCSGAPTRSGAAVIPALCDDLAAENVLGIYSQSGDVRIGHNNANPWSRSYLGPANGSRNAPDDVTIHGILMSSTGIVAVDDHHLGAPRGTVHLVGGVIEHHYGAFGTFNSVTGQPSTGFGRSFTFDRRTSAGLAPPYFPTVGLDGVKSVLAFAYAQREQVE